MQTVIITSIFLGIGLAMDACAVSMANGLNESKMKINKMLLIAFLFSFFQALMPFISYLIGCVLLSKIQWIIPWIALILLSFIGIKMLIEAIKHKNDCCEQCKKITFVVLIVQAIATSIDALSVGFTIANYNFIEALVCVLIIALMTFPICIIGVYIGKHFGTKLGCIAEIIGGIIIISIGVEIFISGMFLN